MKIFTLNPRDCTRWHYADRSSFEFGDISALAEDIKRNGQIEPVLVRKSKDNHYQYEIIAGSRRWKACLEADLQLKAILHDVSDEQASIIQIKENQSLDLCDYSKGIYYAKILQDQKMTQEKLTQNINLSRRKLQNFLCFNKVPQAIWDAVGNISRVSSRTAYTIYTLSKNQQCIPILIELADEIRKGIGSIRLENLVNQILSGKDSTALKSKTITMTSGVIIGSWKNNTIKLSKDLNIDQDKFLQYLAKFFK